LSSGKAKVEVAVTLCDICGEVIPDNLKNDEKGRLLADSWSSTAKATDKKITFRWPTWRKFEEFPPEERYVQGNQPKEYDFHGECLMRVIQEASEARRSSVSTSEEDR